MEDNLIEKNQDVLTNLSNIDTKIAELNENVSFKQDFELIKNSIQDSVQCLHSNFDNLKENLIENNDVLSQKIGSVEETVNHFSNDLKQDILTNLSDLDTKIAELNENISSKQDFELIKNSIQDSVQSLHSNFDNLKENFENTNASEEFVNIQNSLNVILEKFKTNSNFYDSSLEDLAFLKENFYKLNEKFSEITHLIRSNTGENEELNNRFESNLTHFNSCFQNIYEQFNNLENTFNSNFTHFKSCIQDVYDQFSTIDTRSDLDQIKLYVQSFNNKIINISEILETLKENNFSIKIDNEETINLQNKVENLNNNICSLLDNEDSQEIKKELVILKDNLDQLKISFDTHTEFSSVEKTEKHVVVNEKLDSILEETKNFSNKISVEFSTLVNPLSSAIELTCGLKESIDEFLSHDDVKVRKEASQLLDKFENIYQNSENNLECIFNASKQFYEKIEDVKNEFSNLSYDTNSKINDFISKTDTIELKIQNNLSNSETAISSLKNISRFAENQINLTSESLNFLKTGVSQLSEEIDLFRNDITDISSKINKVILNEKENSVSLNSFFKELKEEINVNFETNVENLNQTGEKIVKKLAGELKELNKKIDQIEEISSNTLETSEDVKSALVCIAEWFDTAGKLIEENNRNLKKNSIEKVDSFIKRTEENLTEQIKRISDKLNRFEIRMEGIEGKVEKFQDQQSNREVLNMLSDILEKVELSNERSKSNELILSRLESLELKIEELEDKKVEKRKKRIPEEKI